MKLLIAAALALTLSACGNNQAAQDCFTRHSTKMLTVFESKESILKNYKAELVSHKEILNNHIEVVIAYSAEVANKRIPMTTTIYHCDMGAK